jgi:hypothetical protein
MPANDPDQTVAASIATVLGGSFAWEDDQVDGGGPFPQNRNGEK